MTSDGNDIIKLSQASDMSGYSSGFNKCPFHAVCELRSVLIALQPVERIGRQRNIRP